MKTKQPILQSFQPTPTPRPQLSVRSGLHAGLSGDCSLGVSYWRKELNKLKNVAQALNCA